MSISCPDCGAVASYGRELSHMPDCPSQSRQSREGMGAFSPTVTIPRAQYEALMAARVFVDRAANYDWSHYGARSGLKEQQKEAASVDAALRAAGIETESK